MAGIGLNVPPVNLIETGISAAHRQRQVQCLKDEAGRSGSADVERQIVGHVRCGAPKSRLHSTVAVARSTALTRTSTAASTAF